MSEKTYVTPLAREPEFIITPKGAVNEVGARLRRKAAKFHPNSRGVGQFTTSDAKIQEFLDNHPWMRNHKMLCIGAHGMTPAEEPIEVAPRQTAGPVAVPVIEHAPAPVKKGRRK